MIELGKINTLTVSKEVDFGLYLDGGPLFEEDDGGKRMEILLPSRYVPKNTKPGDSLDVFIYHDSEDRIIATTEKPYVMVGSFACLKVVSVNHFGAFLDWGLSKDLLVPFAEQKPRMEEGKRYVVRAYVDEASDRIVASARLDDFLYDVSEDDFEPGEAVDMFVANKTEMGYKIIINDMFWGLLHHHEVIRDLRRGERLGGFIRHIREDGKIDLCMHLKPSEKIDDVADMIMDQLENSDGFLDVTDKTSPDDIRNRFGISKGKFKKAVGALYKRKRIILSADGIRIAGEKK